MLPLKIKNKIIKKINLNVPAINASGFISGNAIIFTISTGEPVTPG